MNLQIFFYILIVKYVYWSFESSSFFQFLVSLKFQLCKTDIETSFHYCNKWNPEIILGQDDLWVHGIKVILESFKLIEMSTVSRKVV